MSELQELKTERLSQFIRPSLKQQLKRVADRKGLSMAELTERALVAYLKRVSK